MGIQVKGTNGDVGIVRGRGTSKDLLDKIDDCITTRAKSSNDLELRGWI